MALRAFPGKVVEIDLFGAIQMNGRSCLFAIALGCTAFTSVFAQSLLQALPKDGTWATYKINGTVESASHGDSTYTGTLTMRCVGTVYEGMEAYRWIEFDQDLIYFGTPLRSIHKVLISEKFFTSNDHPHMHVKKYWRARGAEAISNVTEVALQVENFAEIAGLLASPLADQTDLGAREVQTDLGLFECDGVKGSVTMNDSAGRKQHRVFKVHSNKKSPFGSVYVEMTKSIAQNNDVTFASTSKCTLEKFGNDAETALPDHQ
jgi:hypothetical protein